jgi:hypothetical protein
VNCANASLCLPPTPTGGILLQASPQHSTVLGCEFADTGSEQMPCLVNMQLPEKATAHWYLTHGRQLSLVLLDQWLTTCRSRLKQCWLFATRGVA